MPMSYVNRGQRFEVRNAVSTPNRVGFFRRPNTCLSQLRHSRKRRTQTMQIMQKAEMRFTGDFCETREKLKGDVNPPSVLSVAVA